MWLYIRSADPTIDSRLQRYLAANAKAERSSRVLHWSRGLSQSVFPGELDPYHRPARFGARFGNAAALVGWNAHIIRTIWQHRKAIQVIHAVDLDSGLGGFIGARMIGAKVVVDLYDSYADSRELKGMIGALTRYVEGRLAHAADLAIIVDEGRRAQHGIRPHEPVLVIENVPLFDPGPRTKTAGSGGLRLGYVGNLEARHRGLEELIMVVQEVPELSLDIAGAGALERDVQLAASACPRIIFHGAVEHSWGMRMLSACDVIIGLYELSLRNHRFAAPNKYYEHLMLGRPLLTSKGTPPGTKVEAHATGWAIADGKAALEAKLVELVADPEAVAAAGHRARTLWENNYAHYLERVIDGEYIDRTMPATRRSAAHH